MTFRAATTATILSLASLAGAFHAPAAHRALAPAAHRDRASASRLPMSAEPESEVDKLRAQAAKYRAEYEQSMKEMGKDPSSGAAASAAAGPVVKNLSVAEAQALSKAINFEAGDAAAQIQSL